MWGKYSMLIKNFPRLLCRPSRHPLPDPYLFFNCSFNCSIYFSHLFFHLSSSFSTFALTSMGLKILFKSSSLNFTFLGWVYKTCLGRNKNVITSNSFLRSLITFLIPSFSFISSVVSHSPSTPSEFSFWSVELFEDNVITLYSGSSCLR